MSVRLKLTLSYAGFLMLAGALLLAAVVGVPDACTTRRAHPRAQLRAGSSCANFAPTAAIVMAFLLAFGLWEVGFSPAACSPR